MDQLFSDALWYMTGAISGLIVSSVLGSLFSLIAPSKKGGYT